jgi:GT2 family glycosyltransferase
MKIVMINDKSNPLVSVIILNCNGRHYLEACLSSVFETDYENFEIIFVDNNSCDGSVPFVMKRFGGDNRLKILVLDKNYGFAGGNNFGIRAACGDLIVFLNNDTIVDKGWLRELVKVMKSNEAIGVCQSKLLRMDDPNRLDCAGGFWYAFGYGYERGSGEIDVGQYDRVEDIFYAKGACLCIRRNLLDKIGGFDENLFLRSEDTDLCWRVWKAGYRVVFVPSSRVYHKRGGTMPDETPKETYFSTKNRWYLLLKHYELKDIVQFIPLLTLVEIYMLLKLLVVGKKQNFVAFLKGLIWPLLNLRSIIIVRKKEQSKMKVKCENIVGRLIMLKNPIYFLIGK